MQRLRTLTAEYSPPATTLRFFELALRSWIGSEPSSTTRQQRRAAFVIADLGVSQ